MSSSNCCFLACIQMSQEAGQVFWDSHLFQNFPQFIVIHTVKGFGIVNKAEIDIFFWNSLAFSMIQRMLAIWSLVPLPFLKPAWISGSSRFTYCWSLAWRILSIILLPVSRGHLNSLAPSFIFQANNHISPASASTSILKDPYGYSRPTQIILGRNPFSRSLTWSCLPVFFGHIRLHIVRV